MPSPAESPRIGNSALPIMLLSSSVLCCCTPKVIVPGRPRAVEVSVYVVRAFVKLRELLATNKGLAVKLAELERKLEGHDTSIHQLVGAIRQLMNPPEPKKKRPIGFGREE